MHIFYALDLGSKENVVEMEPNSERDTHWEVCACYIWLVIVQSILLYSTLIRHCVCRDLNLISDFDARRAEACG